MKYLRMLPTVMLVLLLFVTGCGKSKEHQKIESDLDAEVATLNEDLKSSLSGLSGLQAQLSASLQVHNELKKKFARTMKNHNANDITAATQEIEDARSDAETAIANLATYDKELEHEKAMQALNKDKEALTSAKDKVSKAIDSANAAIDNHEMMKQQLTKKRK